MSLPESLIPAAVALVRLGADALEGKLRGGGDIARSLVGLGLEFVPVEELQRYLSDEAARRAELAADAAERLKFGASADTGVRKRDEPIAYDLQDLDEDEPA